MFDRKYTTLFWNEQENEEKSFSLFFDLILFILVISVFFAPYLPTYKLIVIILSYIFIYINI